MKFGEFLANSQVPEWSIKYIRYRALKKQIFAISKAMADDERLDRRAVVENLEMAALVTQQVEIEGSNHGRFVIGQLPFAPDFVFWRMINDDLEMIGDFYQHKKDEAVEVFRKLREQINALTDAQVAASTAALASDMSSFPERSIRSWIRSSKGSVRDIFKKDTSADVLGSTDGVEHSSISHRSTKKSLFNVVVSPIRPTLDKAAAKALRVAFKEFYRALDFVHQYQQLNATGFSKIIKKYDKITKSHARADFLGTLNETNWVNDKSITEMMTSVETLYTDMLMEGDKHAAMRDLRIPQVVTNNVKHGLFVGLLLGMILSGSALCIAMAAIPEESFAYSIPTLIQFRALFLPLLLVTFIGVNVWIWQYKHVNYVFIFDLDGRRHASHWTIWESSLLCSTICILFLVGYMIISVLGGSLNANWFPLMATTASLVYLFNPLSVLNRNGRFWLLKALGRILAAPFFFVTFPDFWIADQLTSLVVPLQDFEFSVCYWANHFPTEYSSCLSNANGIRPVLSCVPSWTRLMQCFRRYRDAKDKVHLQNAGKYFMSLMTIVFGALDSLNRETDNSWNGFSTTWIVMALISTIYSFWWDIVRDWGLAKGGSKEFLLRAAVVYPKKVYYWAIISDLLLRFAWSLNIAPQALNIGLHPQILRTILSFLEIFRRFQWNFFRLENEHLNNCGKFRAVKEIPLPFIIPLTDTAAESLINFKEHHEDLVSPPPERVEMQ